MLTTALRSFVIMKATRLQLFALSALTLLVMGGIGLLLIVFAHDASLVDFAASGLPLKQQLLQGTIFGIASAVIALGFIRTEWFAESRSFFQQFITELNPSLPEIVFYSFCAGVGEELLFRGGLQPWLGVWITAILFIALHGYLSITDITTTIYGLLMILISAGFGYLMNHVGLFSSMTAHFWFDVVMFAYLKWGYKSRFVG
ncbi:hypothetical protein BH09BAC1_BH09BAC1_04880 [soil metagenome]